MSSACSGVPPHSSVAVIKDFRNFQRRSWRTRCAAASRRPNTELLAVGVLRLDQSVAVSNQHRIGRHDNAAFFKRIIFHHPEHDAAFRQDKWQARRKDRKRAGGPHWCTASGGKPYRRWRQKMWRSDHRRYCESRWMFRRATNSAVLMCLAAGHQQLAAQGGLQAGHQQARRKFPCPKYPQSRTPRGGAKLNEIVVVAAHAARRAADGFHLDAFHMGQIAWKQLVLHFARDGDFVLQSLQLFLLVDQTADGAGHAVERFSQHAKLILALHEHSMREIALPSQIASRDRGSKSCG